MAVAMNVHKVTAGDGYTYLTRSVAVLDGDDRGASSLSDYYSAKGEAPGRWGGMGLAGLGLVEGQVVTEAQMRALFGEGLHPDADEMVKAAIEGGATARDAILSTALGKPFGQPVPDEKVPQPVFVQAVAEALIEYNLTHGNHWKAAVPDEDRARIRSVVGTRMFTEEYGRAPLNSRELSGFITRASRGEKQVCAGYDHTFTLPKSVSALWAVAPLPVAQQIEKAHEAAIKAAVEWAESNVAYTRRGKGGVRQVNVRGLITVGFVHRDSRDSDPHLHTHVVFSNKVQAVDDGAWLALDGRVIYHAAVAASEFYTTRVAAELDKMGIVSQAVTHPSSKAVSLEVVGVPEELAAAWSSRDDAIRVRASQLAREFEQRAGRPPDPKETMAIKRQAHTDTRQAKHEPRSYEEQRAAWRDQAEQVLGGPDAVDAMVRRVLAARRPEAKAVDYQAIVAATLRAVETERAVFTEPHVMAAAHRHVRLAGVPMDQAEIAAQAVTRWVLDQLAVPLRRSDPVAEPVSLQRADGSSVYSTALTSKYTSQTILGAERAILRRASSVDGFRVDETALSLALLEAEANGITLNPGQAALVDALATSGAKVQLALAPAGSGKTTAMKIFANAWTEAGGNVIGLAPSAAAAAELGKATGTLSDTLASLTWTMDLAGDASILPGWAKDVGQATVLLVDEAGMASTLDLAKVTAFAEARGAQVRLIGDDQQLASISSGGVLRDLAHHHGALTLSELMRFRNPAEAGATLAVRDGDTSSIGFWLDNNRLHAVAQLAGVDTVVDAWLADTQQNRESLMIAPTRDLVMQLNEAARSKLNIDTTAELHLRDRQTASVGDVVITRENQRRLRITATDYVKNGDRWTVVAIPAAGGGLTVRHHGTSRILTLPADYVSTQVDLGYAVTVHGAQGATVDTCHAIFAGEETRQLAYVATSRGRDENHVYVLVGGSGDEHDAIRPEVLSPSTAVETIEQILGRDGSQTSATSALAAEHDPASWLGRIVDIYTDATAQAIAELVDDTQVSRDAETVVPGITSARAWPMLRQHLAATVADGRTVEQALTGVLEQANLTDAADPAAGILARLAAATQPAGPLPWLSPVPATVATHETWGPYLSAREQQVRDVVDELLTVSHAQPVPGWARPFLRDQGLVDDLIVWRAAMNVADTGNPDASITGRPLSASAAGMWQMNLHRRATELNRNEQATHRWAPNVASQPQVTTDPWWPVLARRLSLAQRAGIDVTALVAEAITRGPLPDEHAAAALWWRLADTLAPNAAARETTATKVRPDWSHQLVDQLPAGIGDSVLADPEWPTLVATMDTATRAGLDPAQLIAAAAAGLNFVVTDRDDYITAGDAAVMLTWRVNDFIKHHVAGDVAERPVAAEPDDRWFDAPSDEYPPEDPYDAEYAPPPPADLVRPPSPAVGRIVELHDAAAAFYADQYTGSPAAAYVTSRFGNDLAGRPDVTIGYAPDAWDALVQHLRTTTGATDDELVDAGLARFNKRGLLNDVFRNRVVLGIRDQDRQLVGFTGRAAPGADKDTPKYINTPGTDAFRKGEILYGLAEHAGPGKVPVLAEGAFDAIAITLAGAGTVYGVAPCGTSLTNDQAALLAAAAPERRVLVATDQDAAGRKAAEKDYWKLTGVGADPRQLILVGPNGTNVKDPAELYQADNGATLASIVQAHDLAPHLADQLVAARIHADLDHLQMQGNVGAYYLAERDIARIIAPLPPEQWAERVDVAASLLDLDGASKEWRAESIATELYETASQWNPDDPGDPNRNVDAITRLRNFARQHARPASAGIAIAQEERPVPDPPRVAGPPRGSSIG